MAVGQRFRRETTATGLTFPKDCPRLARELRVGAAYGQVSLVLDARSAVTVAAALEAAARPAPPVSADPKGGHAAGPRPVTGSTERRGPGDGAAFMVVVCCVFIGYALGLHFIGAP